MSRYLNLSILLFALLLGRLGLAEDAVIFEPGSHPNLELLRNLPSISGEARVFDFSSGVREALTPLPDGAAQGKRVMMVVGENQLREFMASKDTIERAAASGVTVHVVFTDTETKFQAVQDRQWSSLKDHIQFQPYGFLDRHVFRDLLAVRDIMQAEKLPCRFCNDPFLFLGAYQDFMTFIGSYPGVDDQHGAVNPRNWHRGRLETLNIQELFEIVALVAKDPLSHFLESRIESRFTAEPNALTPKKLEMFKATNFLSDNPYEKGTYLSAVFNVFQAFGLQQRPRLKQVAKIFDGSQNHQDAQAIRSVIETLFHRTDLRVLLAKGNDNQKAPLVEGALEVRTRLSMLPETYLGENQEASRRYWVRLAPFIPVSVLPKVLKATPHLLSWQAQGVPVFVEELFKRPDRLAVGEVLIRDFVEASVVPNLTQIRQFFATHWNLLRKLEESPQKDQLRRQLAAATLRQWQNHIHQQSGVLNPTERIFAEALSRGQSQPRESSETFWKKVVKQLELMSPKANEPEAKFVWLSIFNVVPKQLTVKWMRESSHQTPLSYSPSTDGPAPSPKSPVQCKHVLK